MFNLQFTHSVFLKKVSVLILSCLLSFENFSVSCVAYTNVSVVSCNQSDIFFFSIFQLWRLVTNFLYFGPIGFNFLFNLIFTYRYCRMLEEGSFRGKTADFFFMFLFGGTVMTVSFSIINLAVLLAK